ncbi:MmcQ/YjbR family DNA-binding protein [Hymenobacter sp. BT188]|uniref:MmcQ/YjbR family DNA-binding protein n=1 Tax=Hymenobacter sp. BT188 TaxID=2763504 RepID=UPI0016518B4E|nr:MmcQ/YjbR family DNA-binding protein [Hymenobacter sp. BT188]MBC6605815.1 MmcQ/YjbR family DNA-binding protein [Hymenobacter sp. BT188]
MNIEDYRDYCLLKSGVTEETPFDDDTLVFKVGGKIFALTSISQYGSVNLKCDPERAVQLREEFDYVLPGYHMNKKHWNTVVIGSGVSASQLREWTDHSYDLVRASLPRAIREELAKDC